MARNRRDFAIFSAWHSWFGVYAGPLEIEEFREEHVK
jgi:hypothetical protein